MDQEVHNHSALTLLGLGRARCGITIIVRMSAVTTIRRQRISHRPNGPGVQKLPPPTSADGVRRNPVFSYGANTIGPSRRHLCIVARQIASSADNCCTNAGAYPCQLLSSRCMPTPSTIRPSGGGPSNGAGAHTHWEPGGTGPATVSSFPDTKS